MHIEVLDLIPTYLRCRARQAWAEYEQAYPQLFRHYNRYWAGDDFPYADLAPHEAKRRAGMIHARLPAIQQALQAAFPQGDHVKVALFVGKGTSNGHAFWDEERRAYVVWLPVEAYTTFLQVDVFVTHEILHALQYAHQPELYFTNERQMKRVGRQVVTEGFATYGTMQVLGCDERTALWADYVPPAFAHAWYGQCRRREGELMARILREWNASPQDNPWFTMWDETDVSRYRGGYYVGLRVFQELVRRHQADLPTMLAWAANALETRALEIVAQLYEG